MVSGHTSEYFLLEDSFSNNDYILTAANDRYSVTVYSHESKMKIEQADGVWFVEAPWLEQLMGSVNFSDYESRMFFDRVLREAHVFEKLEEAGIRDGETVVLYNLEFEYQS